MLSQKSYRFFQHPSPKENFLEKWCAGEGCWVFISSKFTFLPPPDLSVISPLQHQQSFEADLILPLQSPVMPEILVKLEGIRWISVKITKITKKKKRHTGKQTRSFPHSNSVLIWDIKTPLHVNKSSELGKSLMFSTLLCADGAMSELQLPSIPQLGFIFKTHR